MEGGLAGCGSMDPGGLCPMGSEDTDFAIPGAGDTWEALKRCPQGSFTLVNTGGLHPSHLDPAGN